MLKKLLWLTLLVFILTGCASPEDDPLLIAAYPSEKQITVYPITRPNTIVVYNATIDLEVSNVDKTVQKTEGLAYQYGGYLASSQSWFQGDQKYTIMLRSKLRNSH